MVHVPGMAPKRGSIEAAFAGKAKGAKSKKARELPGPV